MVHDQAQGLRQTQAAGLQRPVLSLWTEVAALSVEQEREVRRTLESELGDGFVIAQGLSKEALGGVALVPLVDGSDAAWFAVGHRIRERIEQGHAPRRLIFVAGGAPDVSLPKNQTGEWLRQTLGKCLDSEPFFVGGLLTPSGHQSPGGKKLPLSSPRHDKNIRALEGFSRLLLDWWTGEKRSAEKLDFEEKSSLKNEILAVVVERWGVLKTSTPRSFPMDHQFQEESRFRASALNWKSEKCEAGRFDSARVDVSAGNRIGGNRE